MRDETVNYLAIALGVFGVFILITGFAVPPSSYTAVATNKTQTNETGSFESYSVSYQPQTTPNPEKPVNESSLSDYERFVINESIERGNITLSGESPFEESEILVEKDGKRYKIDIKEKNPTQKTIITIGTTAMLASFFIFFKNRDVNNHYDFDDWEED